MDTTELIHRLTTDTGPFTTADVANLTGATFRQLDYWTRNGIITPSRTLTEVGSGHQRQWDRDAVLEAAITKRFADAGIDLGLIREATDVIHLAQTLMRSLHDIINLATSKPTPAA